MHTTRHRQRLLTGSAALLIAATVLAAPALAQEATPGAAEPRIGIAPVGYDGSWFDLELAAGESRHLSVELANHGEQPIDVHSYAADVYTLIGGGMGVTLRESAVTGTTRWVDYPAATLALDPDEGERRTVTVTVPDDAAPGQYIAALVIENDHPIRAEGELSVDRVMRQAVAINVTVPGPPEPGLAIGQARHTDPGGRSVVLLGVDNTGDRHLRPAGRLTLTGPAGDIVATRDLEMDIHFAGTPTEVELNLEELLAPGIYTLAAELRDDEYDLEATGSAQFEVLAPPRQGSAIPGRDRIEDALRDAGLPTWLLLVAAALVLALTIAVLAMLVVRGLGRRRPSAATPERPAPCARPEETAGPVAPRAAMVSAPPTLPPPPPPPPPPPGPATPRGPAGLIEDRLSPLPAVTSAGPERPAPVTSGWDGAGPARGPHAPGTRLTEPMDLGRFTARTAPKRADRRRRKLGLTLRRRRHEPRPGGRTPGRGG